MARQLILALGAGAVGGVLWMAIDFWRRDPEVLELTAEARAAVGGQFVKIANGTVHYDFAPPRNGRTVVLVHGFSVPYYLWDPTFRALADAGFGVLRYDLFGRGFSDRPDIAYDGAHFEQQLTDLLDALRIQDRIDLVGASMGGPIVAGFACRHIERVRSVSLFDPGYSRGGQPLPFKLRIPILGEYVLATEIAPRLPAAQMADFLHPEGFPDWAEKYRAQMQYKGFRRALLSTLRRYVSADWSKDYECIGSRGVPTLLVWGKADRDVPFETSQDVRAAIPKAEFLPVEDAAHVPFLEHPEIVHPALLRFLQQH